MAIVIIAGYMEIDADKRAAALAAGEPEIEGALTQPGCEAYVWTPDPHVDDRIHVFEKWTSGEDLAAHLAGPWYKGMLGVLGSHGVRNGVVAKYQVDRTCPVYDSSGKARADFWDE